MLDLNNELMDFKLTLRAISKPGDNLWEVVPEEGINGFVVSASDEDEDGVSCNFSVMYDIAMVGTSPLYIEYEAFDDAGEWEFKILQVGHKFKRMR